MATIIDPSQLEKYKKLEESISNQNMNPKAVALDQNVIGLDLPSKYLFYNKDVINIRSLKFRELILIGGAQESGSMRSIAEAIANTVLDYNGLNMTYGDYQFIMYLHRTQLKKPLNAEWICESEKHLKMIENKEVDKDSLNQSVQVKKSNLELFYPDEKELKILTENGQLLPGLHVYPPSILDIVDTAEEIEEITANVDSNDIKSLRKTAKQTAEINLMNRYAMHLNPEYHGKTLTSRRKFLEEFFDNFNENHYDVIEKFNKYEKSVDHGVKENVKVSCEVCGVERTIDVSFNSTDFFPETQ